ncbi:helix-turn-helix domain-containing protein [Polluticaenibacter yanchengensis]|uniref:Helix-turn-helix domain-containing protein n=1 Tax=Polluticaenibacter yanchengensis TaxID=3014562 RepID=A0ABT4ULI3_9BACT|nr:helix-turn-helix domain-containing protein [Chitinophagaceae bacterium LY-5]
MISLPFRQMLYGITLLFGLCLFACTPKRNTKNIAAANFDSLYIDIATRIAATQSDSAFALADFLMENATSAPELMRVQMLQATLHDRNGNSAKAIALAKKAYLLAKKDKNDDWLLRINGFLSTAYREIGLFDYGKVYLKEATTIIEKIGTPILQSFILQEKSFYSIEDQQFETALHDLKESNKIINNLKDKVPLNSFFGAVNSQMIGICYKGLGEFDSAINYFKISLDTLGNFETELKGFNYIGLARAEIAKGELSDALINLEKCKTYVENSKNFKLKKLLLEGYIEYYAQSGEKQAELETQQAYLNTKQEEERILRNVVNQIIEESDGKIRNSEQKSLQLLYLAIIVCIIAGAFLYYLYYKNKKQKKIFNGIIQRLLEDRNFILNKAENVYSKPLFLNEAAASEPENPDMPEAGGKLYNTGFIEDAEIIEEITPGENNGAEELAVEKNAKRKMSIPKETFDKIVEKLKQFEDENLYLNPEMSLAALASLIQVNVKYLSYVINEYKHYDFNNYINRLRISYIINKLQNSPEYLNYKIAFLAEECGFVSHSKFAVVFKQILNMSPSDFIRHLKAETKQV